MSYVTGMRNEPVSVEKCMVSPNRPSERIIAMQHNIASRLCRIVEMLERLHHLRLPVEYPGSDTKNSVVARDTPPVFNEMGLIIDACNESISRIEFLVNTIDTN